MGEYEYTGIGWYERYTRENREDLLRKRAQLFRPFIRTGLVDLFAGIDPDAPTIIRRRYGDDHEDSFELRWETRAVPTFASIMPEFRFNKRTAISRVEDLCYHKLKFVYVDNRLFIQPTVEGETPAYADTFPPYLVIPRGQPYFLHSTELDLLMLPRGIEFALKGGGYRSLSGLARASDEDLKKLSHRNTRIKDHLPVVRRQLDIVKQWLTREKTRVAGANSA